MRSPLRALLLALAAVAVQALMVTAFAWPAARIAPRDLPIVVAGLASGAVAQTGLSVLPGPYLGVAGVIGLATFAVSGAVAGLGAAVGRAGIGLGAAAMILLANPLSGVTSAPEMLPRPWGEIGQGMPAGAGATLLRSVAFFGGSGVGGPLAVLLTWSVAGLALLAVGALRVRRSRAGGVPGKNAPEFVQVES